MNKWKLPPPSDAYSVQSLISIHNTTASIKKNESQRKVHKVVPEGREVSLKTKSTLKDERVDVPLVTLYETLFARLGELETCEQKAKAWKKIIWKGRYCGYTAKALTRVKPSSS